MAVGTGEDIEDLVVATVSASYFDFFVVGVLASAIPAMRAARVDPNIALRAEYPGATQV